MKIPQFNSAEHLAWISKRLAKNIRFRHECEGWASVPLDRKRIIAAALIGRPIARAA